MVKSFNRDQRAALSLIPQSRMLLETDSPHLPVGGGVIYATPAYIGEVGELVAEIRGDRL